MKHRVDRRRFLQLSTGASLGLTGWLAQGCGSSAGAPMAGPGGVPVDVPVDPSLPAIFTPKVNGGITVHAVRRLDDDPNEGANFVIVPELITLQLRALYELGFEGMRLGVSVSDRGGLLAAIPYARAARALGLDLCLILTEAGGVEMARALWLGSQRSEILPLFDKIFATPPAPAAPGAGGLGPGGVGRVAFQILNEPALFVGVSPEMYVREILLPTYGELRQMNRNIIVVSAAEVGTFDGPPRVRAMLEAGLEQACDRVAYHIYEREIIEQLPPHIRATIWITETGTAGVTSHLPWVREVYPEIRRRLEDVTEIFFYDLYDRDPNRHRIINIQQTSTGYDAVLESADLCTYFVQKARERAAGRPLIPFETLIPDIHAYFPTADDLAMIDEILGPPRF
jgi:hypothetical protein